MYEEKDPVLEEKEEETQDEGEHIPVEDEPKSIEVEQKVSPVDTFPCPLCGEEQDHFVDPKKRGWVRCPACGKHVRSKQIPAHLIIEEPEKDDTEEEYPSDVYEDTSDLYEDDDSTPQGDDEGLYREPTPPHKSLEKVLTHHGVRKKALNMIVTRCKRMGKMHETDLERMLYDLKTGVGNKAIKYIIEDYVLEVENENERVRNLEYSGDYAPSRERSLSRSDTPSRQRPRSGRGDWGGTPWDRRRGNEAEAMSKDEVLDFIDKRDRERDRRLAAEKKDEEILKLREVAARLEQKLEDWEDNPPSSVPDDMLTKADLEEAKNTDYVKALQLQLETQREDRKREDDQRREELRTMRDEAKDSRDRVEQQAKEDRERYEKRMDDLQNKLEGEQQRVRDAAGSKSDTYTSDQMRFAAEGLHKLGDVINKRGSPVQQLAEILPKLQQLMGQGSGQPPVRERMGPSSVADLVAEERPDLVR